MPMSAAPEGPRPGDRAVAVALRYDLASERPPQVVAGGHGAIAEQILAIAFANGVKVREDADLAELLAAVDIDADIPVAAFAAVAEILVHVYRANGTLPPPAAPPIAGPEAGRDG